MTIATLSRVSDLSQLNSVPGKGRLTDIDLGVSVSRLAGHARELTPACSLERR